MLDRLAAGPLPVGELARPLTITLAAALQHVQVLQACGLITSRKTGRVRICTVSPAALQVAEQWLAERRAVWEHRFDRLGTILDEQKPGSDHRKDSE